MSSDKFAPPTESKSAGLAAALSFLVPGLGHIYVDDVGVGIVYMVAGVLGYLAFVIPGIAIHLASIIHAYRSANRATSRYQYEKKEAERAAKERQVKQESTLKATDFIERMEKLSKLHNHDILTEKEFSDKKKQLITELGRKKVDAEPEDFLISLTELKDRVLDQEDIALIKSKVL